MITCSECRHWRNTDHWSAPTGPTIGRCKSPKFIYGYDIDPETELPADGIVIENDEGWGCYTGPKFGCIHGEAK